MVLTAAMPDKKAEDKEAMAYGMAWFMNVSTCVLIVFINKVLMDHKHGYNFTFAITLSAFHFISCAGVIWVAQALRLVQSAKLPWADSIYFAIIANLSIASLNLSLLINTVGFYQMAKLLVIPFVCLVEVVWLKRTLTPPVVLSVCTVVVGVAVVSVSDVSMNNTGLLIAGISVITSGMQQILCGTMQKKHQISSHQLLANTAPLQGAMLLVVGPCMDQWVTGAWIGGYEWRMPAFCYLVTSCMIAVLVNISQFMCLGRFSAVTFQVLGHTKTVLVLLISWLLLHEPMATRKLMGMALAVAGMIAYGYFTSRPGQQPEQQQQQQQQQQAKGPQLIQHKDRQSDDVMQQTGDGFIGTGDYKHVAPNS